MARLAVPTHRIAFGDPADELETEVNLKSGGNLYERWFAQAEVMLSEILSDWEALLELDLNEC